MSLKQIKNSIIKRSSLLEIGGGFTFIELILIVAIIGILAAVAIPRLGGRDFFVQLTLRTTAHVIASDIRYTRRLAITNGERYIIRFYPSKHEYGIYREKVTQVDLVGELREVPPEIDMQIDSIGNEFIFEKLGNASISGMLTLKTGDNLEYQYDIIVEPVTGAVIVERIS